MRLLLLLLGILYFQQIAAQKLKYPTDFLLKLEQMSLEIVTPVESDYRDVFALQNSVLNYDFAMKSSKEKMEIRYIIQPSKPNDPLAALPDVKFIQTLTHLATNREEAFPMTIHEVHPNDLQEIFRADWGKFAFFQPKSEFAVWQHAKLLSLYRAEKGIVYVLFLFNRASADLDRRFHAVQFFDTL